jgi:thioredoxin-dependent peroxiredoxin
MPPTGRELTEGSKAPDFALPGSNGRQVNLSDYKGKSVVLYFYPKDDTPGCTKEACFFRDNMPKFQDLDAVVLGVSKDPLDSHADFVKKYGLNFTLLSDEDLTVNNLYGTWVEKENYGRKYWGTERSTFVIGPDGKIKKIFRKVRVDGHEAEVLQALA